MLTAGDSKIVFAYISLGSLLAYIPYNLNWRSGKFSKISLLKNFCRWLICFLTLAHTGYSVLYFVYLRLFGPAMPAQLVLWQFAFAFNPSVYMTQVYFSRGGPKGGLGGLKPPL